MKCSFQPLLLYEVKESLEKDINQLPARVQDAIESKHIPKIAADPYAVSEPLHGNLRGLRSYHFGREPEYRMVYYIRENRIIVIAVGPHNQAYRRARYRRIENCDEKC